MIKNTFLVLVIAVSAISAQAQISTPKTNFPRVSSPVENFRWELDAPTQRLAKKGGFSGSGWYNYISAIREGGETFSYYGDVTLWPDSLPVALYPDGPSHLGIYAIGEVFDPTSEWFQGETTPQLTGFNRYSIDSIILSYKYRHVVPGSVDTLIIDFFNNDKLVSLTFNQSGARTLSPTYNPKTNRSTNYTSTTKILLTDADNTEEFFYPSSASYTKTLVIALPLPMQVKAAGRMAFTMCIKPGVSWKMNDTLANGRDSINLPKKGLNTFQPFYLAAQTGVPDVSYNYALEALRGQRYSINTSGDWYQPYNFPGAKIRHLDATFKLTYYNLSAKDINTQGYGLGNLYPNPVKVGSDVKIEFALGNSEIVNVQLFNILGSKVADITSGKFVSGENSVVYNTSSLAPGVYVYTINAGGFKASKKFTVIN